MVDLTHSTAIGTLMHDNVGASAHPTRLLGFATMRFRLVAAWGGLSQLYVGETRVPVRCPSLRRQHEDAERIAWTWLDGTEYALLRPRWPDGQLRVVSGERIVCCGRLFQGLGGLAQVFRQGRVTLSEWEFDGHTIVWNGGALCWKLFPYTFTLRQPDGIRLAFISVERGRSLIRRAAYSGVVRDGLPDRLVPVVFAIILAGFHAPDLF
jgi:hypothetical protein